MKTKKLGACVAGAALLMIAASAGAHPGHIENALGAETFLAGLVHPLTGFDHLLAMLAVGLWSAMTHESPRKAMTTPLSFLALLLVGAVLGIKGVRLPAVEPVILASLLVLGLLVATRLALPQWAGSMLVGFFALFHGLAHGSELPASGSAAAFVAGFMLTSLALHVTGLITGFHIKHREQWIARVLGSCIAAYGLGLLAAL